MTVRTPILEVKTELQRHGLPTTGTEDELVASLAREQAAVAEAASTLMPAEIAAERMRLESTNTTVSITASRQRFLLVSGNWLERAHLQRVAFDAHSPGTIFKKNLFM